VRSGECTTYEEVISKVLDVVRSQAQAVPTVGREGSPVQVSEDALREGVRAIKAEVENVLDVKVDDIDD
jgi:hypothetical protein